MILLVNINKFKKEVNLKLDFILEIDKKQKPEGFAFYQKSIKDFYLSNFEIIS